jgi:hypothetical protein
MSIIVMNAGEWCPPCRQFATDSETTLQALNEADDRYDVKIVQIMIDDGTREGSANQASVTAWAETHGISSYPVIFGEEENLAALFALLQERIDRDGFSIPSYWVVDPLGQIRFYGEGWRFPNMEGDPIGPALELMSEQFDIFLGENPEWMRQASTEDEMDPGEGDDESNMPPSGGSEVPPEDP